MHDFRQWWDTVWAQAVHDQQLLGTHAFEVNRAKLAARRVRVTRDHRRSYGKCHRISSHTGVAASPCAMASKESTNPRHRSGSPRDACRYARLNRVTRALKQGFRNRLPRAEISDSGGPPFEL